MTKFLIGAAAAAITAAAAIAQPSPPMQRQNLAEVQTRADVQAHVAQMFARFDTNRDGFIAKPEADAAMAQFAAQRPHRAPGQGMDRSKAFDRIDANRDGSISRNEFASRPQRAHDGMRMAGMHRGFAGRMFGMADVNRDGRVSLAEAQQLALQHFDRADLNHDGTLTPQERQQAHQLMRAQRRPS